MKLELIFKSSLKILEFEKKCVKIRITRFKNMQNQAQTHNQKNLAKKMVSYFSLEGRTNQC